MDAVFAGEPGPLPGVQAPTATWSVASSDAPRAPEPRVQHAEGYAPFVSFAAEYGTDVRALFDLWMFAHFIRAHRAALQADPDLLRSAVVFLGNVLIAAHPECVWTGRGGLAVESPQHLVEEDDGVHLEPAGQRFIRVGDTVPAILDADEERFRAFASVVEDWRPGAPVREVSRSGPRRRS